MSKGFVALILALCWGSLAWAQVPVPQFELGALGLSDQWDKPLENPGKVKWVAAAADMTAHAAVKLEFDKLGRDWLNQRGLIYVADISGMPSLITKLFGLPKMRKYSYPIYLDRQGDLVESWQIPAEKFLLMQMEQGRPVAAQVVADFAALKAALEQP